MISIRKESIVLDFQSFIKRTFIASMILTSISCELVIDVDLPEFEQSLVVNSFISEDSAVTAFVSLDNFILNNNQTKMVEGATITLKEEGTEVTTLVAVGSGLYSSSFYPSRGKEYEMIVEHPQYETAKGKATIPTTLPVISKLEFERTFNASGFEEQEIKVTIDDPLEESFYEIIFYYNEYYFEFDADNPQLIVGVESYQNKLYVYSEDVIFDEYSGYNDVWVFADELFNGKKQTIRFTSSYYNNYDWLENFEFADSVEFDPETKVKAAIRGVSEDYYLYHRTSTVQSYNEGNPFSEPVQVFNNIENGFGIFAGYNQVVFQ